jgi:hypothetical protein
MLPLGGSKEVESLGFDLPGGQPVLLDAMIENDRIL